MISKSAANFRRRYAENTARWWESFFSSPPAEDGFMLFGPSSYLFRAGGARLLVDPCFRDPAWGEPLAGRITADLETLDGIILTHEHIDHCDPHFIRMAAGAKVRWFIPDFFSFEALHALGLPPERIVPVRPGDRVTLGGCTLRFFESNHRNEGWTSFVREYGFCLTHGERNYLFPCDVRDYDPAFYPDLPDADILFAHLWLGKAQALTPPWEPKLTQFCRFLQAFRPRAVTLAHLYEVAREPEEMWTWQHAGAVADRMLALSPETSLTVPEPGRWYPFDRLLRI